MQHTLDDAYLSYRSISAKLLLLLCCDWLILVRSVFGTSFLFQLLVLMTIKHTLMFPLPSHLLYYIVMAVIPAIWFLRLFHRATSPKLRMLYPDSRFNGLITHGMQNPRYNLLVVQPAIVVAIAAANVYWSEGRAAPISMPWYAWWGTLAEVVAGNRQSSPSITLTVMQSLEETAKQIMGTNFSMSSITSTSVLVASLHPFAGALALYLHNRLDLAALEAGGEEEIKKAKRKQREAAQDQYTKRHGDVSGPL